MIEPGPDQLPSFAVNVLPTRASPEMVGLASFRGGPLNEAVKVVDVLAVML